MLIGVAKMQHTMQNKDELLINPTMHATHGKKILRVRGV